MLVGRAAETAAIDALLDAAREGRSGVVVVRGEAGVGKSSLLEHAVERAEGFTVLRGTGVEFESELAYAALHQILRPAFDRIDRLPEPQAAALRAAFALSGETVDERFRVSLGVLGLLSEVAEEQPLLCIVDDAHWLDKASSDALLFAARRLEAERLAVLFAARDDDAASFAAHDIEELRVSALSDPDSRALLAQQFGTALAPGVVEWLVANAGGNPLALAELPANLTMPQRTGRDPLAGRLPPATSVEQVYLERVGALQAETRSLLVLAAAEDTGARPTVERAAAELGLDMGALAEAEAVGLVRVDSGRLVFRHPLARTAIYRGASFAERERAHSVLAVAASAEGNADRAAWHRASATSGTDEDVARELELTAKRARIRGGHAAAASALERAAQLSGDPESKARRLVVAARAAWQAGQPERARALVHAADPIVTDPLQHAEVEHIRGQFELRCGRLSDAGAILVAGAEDVAPIEPRKAFAMLHDAAAAAGRSGDFDRTQEIARQVLALPPSGDEDEAVLADLLVGTGTVLIGGRTSREIPRIRDALMRAGSSDDYRVLLRGAWGASALGDTATEGALLQRAMGLARGSGAVDALVNVLEMVVNSGMLAGRYTVDAEALEGLALAREAGLSNAVTVHLASLCWLAALRGHDEECRAYAAEVADAVRGSGLANANSIAEWGVALLDLSRGRHDDAADRLLALGAAPPGRSHPWLVLVSTPDLVEACVRAGRGDEARAAVAVLEGFAEPEAPPWVRAMAARSRALLAEDEQEAEDAYLEALALHAGSDHPNERARIELLYGEFLRRARRRTDSREHLRAALMVFEQLHAEPWAERARTELRASGETARKRDPSTIDQLTPQELQIARLVGEGNSNKEVAAQLFLSSRTVEYHLRKVFAKLGIASRAELIRHGVGQAQTEAVVA